jgi:CheY-like chemotaxis protein/HPt (histidine-containing phosphotransfer) domain-containing protein
MQSRDADQIADTYILVAEDDPIARLVLEKMLEQAGYRSCFVADGREAIDELKLMDYDLVLMDCFMPRLDGFTATKLIRNSSSGDINPQIPIIAMTGLTGEDNRRRCLDAGMDEHIAKPVAVGELVAAIERCLGRNEDGVSVLKHKASVEKPSWDDTFLDTLIDRFLGEIPEIVESLLRAEERDDLAELERIGHRLRGASDILELTVLSARSQALEQAGKAGDLLNASRLASEVRVELNKMYAALKIQGDH